MAHWLKPNNRATGCNSPFLFSGRVALEEGRCCRFRICYCDMLDHPTGTPASAGLDISLDLPDARRRIRRNHAKSQAFNLERLPRESASRATIWSRKPDALRILVRLRSSGFPFEESVR